MPQSNRDKFAGDEQTLDGTLVMSEWGITWPRAVARAWAASEDDPWRQDLMSGCLDRVRGALEQIGFTSHWDEDQKKYVPSPRLQFFWDNTEIIIKAPSEGINIISLDGSVKESLPTEDTRGAEFEYDDKATDRNGWVDTMRIRHHVVMTLPHAPRVEAQAMALADYEGRGSIYPFTCCF